LRILHNIYDKRLTASYWNQDDPDLTVPLETSMNYSWRCTGLNY